MHSVVKNIIEGVGYIHERGYMHRDLKPENILLCDNPSTTLTDPAYPKINIKIVDFGLSVEHKNGPISLRHQIDDKVGTLVYMAPE